jgi:hypothetical protein
MDAGASSIQRSSVTTGSIGPGTVLADRYRLEDLLADNEGARFWRATDTVLARNVAVHAVSTDDPRSSALLEAAQLSATVIDPHLLRVLDCDDSEDITWVVNEWGDGVSLDLMLQQGTLPPSRAAWLTREVADAIAAGHAAGVAHGRLNPEAVLVTHAGAVKLIGYVVDASLEPAAPPDPIYGDLDDREADVINLAGILYAALTGRWPGVARSAVPPAPRDGRRPMRPRQVRAGVPRTLDAICERVLTKEASQHAMPIETAAEVAAALADYVGEPGLAAPLDATGMHVEPTVSIPRGDLTSSLRGAGAAAAAPPTQAAGPVPEEDPQEGPQPEPGAETAAHQAIDTDALEDTQLSAALGEHLGALHPPRTERATPPPPFEDLPERPLFAGTERRAPRYDDSPTQGVSASPGTWSQSSRSEDTGTSSATTSGVLTGVSPGIGDNGGFWPFVDPSDDRFEVHTGREGRGWLRMGIIAAVVLIVIVAAAIAFNRGRQDGGGSSSGGGAPSSTAPTTGARIPVTKATAFDPLGDGSENSAEVGKVVDDDPTSGWQTSTYYNNPALGGLKAGVGVLLDLGTDKHPASVTIRFKGQPTDVEVYAASSGVTQAPDALDQLTKVGAEKAATTSATIRLDGKPRTRYLLVWLTRLPAVPGGYRGEITDAVVRS